MKITIGIPCYKQAEYLPQAIQSALDQTYKDIEIIVVNDGSPDNTEEVAKQFPVTVINQVNKGLASARNTALMNATGDYFLPLDADDILMPNCVQRIVDYIGLTGAPIIAPSFRTFGVSEQEVILMPDPTVEDFVTGNRIGYFSAIKTSVLKSIGGYSPRMTWGFEDYHLWFDLLKRGYEIVTIPEVLVSYRTKEHSMINVANAHSKELMDQIIKDHPTAWR